MNKNILIVASMILLLALGIGIGWGVGTTASPSPATTTANQTSAISATGNSTYALTLVEIMQNEWNSSAPAQPKFFVLGSHGLESSANISLPVHRLIQLTILSYDTPTTNSNAQEARVTGTVGGKVYLINGTLATGMSDQSMANAMAWGENVTSLPVASLAHTFTIQQLGINIPVAAGSTEIAYLHFDQVGTYTWVCLTPCGLGNDGLSGAMDTSGWMMGSLMVH